MRYDPRDWTDDMWYGCSDGRGSCGKYGMDINHPGPVLAHLGKVPDGVDVTEYDGSGEWTKVYSLGFEYRNGTKWPVFWLAYNEEKTPVPRVRFLLSMEMMAGQLMHTVRVQDSATNALRAVPVTHRPHLGILGGWRSSMYVILRRKAGL